MYCLHFVDTDFADFCGTTVSYHIIQFRLS